MAVTEGLAPMLHQISPTSLSRPPVRPNLADHVQNIVRYLIREIGYGNKYQIRTTNNTHEFGSKWMIQHIMCTKIQKYKLLSDDGFYSYLAKISAAKATIQCNVDQTTHTTTIDRQKAL